MSPDLEALEAISQGEHHNPHSVLGLHSEGKNWVVRALRPFATEVFLKTKTKKLNFQHVHGGIWELLGSGKAPVAYRIIASYESAPDWISVDPYNFNPTIGEIDLHLISEGRHENLWKVLGSELVTGKDAIGDTSGTRFAVWAPNARAVRVVGDFNGWDGTCYQMRSMGSSGVWELFIPGVAAGALYKYEIRTRDNQWLTKIDPMGNQFETPPSTATVVTNSNYKWGDGKWLDKRLAANQMRAPMAIYELHMGSWRKGKNYRNIAEDLIGHVKHLGFTHVEFMPLAEHPFGGSWGYQVTGYYAPTSRFGSPDDLKYLIDQLHQAEIGVIMDWVPAHFPKDDWALAKFDGEALYEDADPRRGDHPDWGTHVFNFGRNEVKNFLVANACYWLEEFHVDGLRVDAVASMLYLDYSREEGQWLPNIHGGRENLDAIEFLKETNATAYRKNPGIMMIAEESTAFAGVSSPTDQNGLGFGFKWNMGWMHDSLEYIQHEPVHRKYHHNELTFSLLYAYDEKFVLPISHDEVVHGKGSLLSKMPGDDWQKRANMRAYLGFMWSHPGKKLLFMGQEFAQISEWDESRELDWWLLDHFEHSGMQKMVSEMNRNYLDTPALWELDHESEGFQWIDGGNADQNLVSFIRKDSKGETCLVIANFAPTVHEDFRIGVPAAGGWKELFNTDHNDYGGSGVGNHSALETEQVSSHGHPQSLRLSVPPLAVIWLKHA